VKKIKRHGACGTLYWLSSPVEIANSINKHFFEEKDPVNPRPWANVNALGRTAENALADDQQTSTKKFLMNIFCAAGCKLQHEKYPGSKKYVQAQGAAGWNHLSVHQRFSLPGQ